MTDASSSLGPVLVRSESRRQGIFPPPAPITFKTCGPGGSGSGRQTAGSDSG